MPIEELEELLRAGEVIDISNWRDGVLGIHKWVSDSGAGNIYYYRDVVKVIGEEIRTVAQQVVANKEVVEGAAVTFTTTSTALVGANFWQVLGVAAKVCGAAAGIAGGIAAGAYIGYKISKDHPEWFEDIWGRLYDKGYTRNKQILTFYADGVYDVPEEIMVEFINAISASGWDVEMVNVDFADYPNLKSVLPSQIGILTTSKTYYMGNYRFVGQPLTAYLFDTTNVGTHVNEQWGWLVSANDAPGTAYQWDSDANRWTIYPLGSIWTGESHPDGDDSKWLYNPTWWFGLGVPPTIPGRFPIPKLSQDAINELYRLLKSFQPSNPPDPNSITPYYPSISSDEIPKYYPNWVPKPQTDSLPRRLPVEINPGPDDSTNDVIKPNPKPDIVPIPTPPSTDPLPNPDEFPDDPGYSPEITPNPTPDVPPIPGSQPQPGDNPNPEPPPASDPDPDSPPVPNLPVPDSPPVNPPSPDQPDPPPSDTPPEIFLDPGTSAIPAVYWDAPATFQKLNEVLWGNALTDLQKIWSDPMSSIISLHLLPISFDETSPTATICLGNYRTDISSHTLSKHVVEVDFGTVSIPHLHNNPMDYPPYTALRVYLPYIGFRELDMNECVGQNIGLKYNIDVLTGACVANISVGGTILYTYNGAMAYQIPLSSLDASGAWSTLASLAVGAISGNPAVAIGAATIRGLSSNITSVDRSGSLSSNVGYLAPQTPYIVLEYHNSGMPDNYEQLMGKPASARVYIGNCSGYARFRNVKLQAPATQAEKNEIIELLQAGVYI